MRRRFLSNIKSIQNDYHSEYFTIEALRDGLTASLSTNACEYCIDNGSWNNLSAGSKTPSINKGQILSFRGNLTPNSSNGIGTFAINMYCNIKGNIMSLLYGDNFEGQIDLSGKNYTFYNLFTNCVTIRNAKNLILPATTLADHCYSNMFEGCTSLTTAPELPATTLASYCYSHIFQGCTSLVTAPELPATRLVDWCYEYMFSGCSKLNKITMLATDKSAAYRCLINWVYGVSSTGTFVKHSQMTSLPNGNDGIPSGWAVVNDGETGGPNLITFTIDGTEYQAEDGMTWEEWVNSEYDDGNYLVYNAYAIARFQGTSLVYVFDNTQTVFKSDLVKSNYSYNLQAMGAGS